MPQALLSAVPTHYEIDLEPHLLVLFAFILRESDHRMDRLPEQQGWRHWQQYMSDIIIQKAGEPIHLSLQPISHLYLDGRD